MFYRVLKISPLNTYLTVINFIELMGIINGMKMKQISLYFFIVATLLIVQSCGSDYSAIDKNVTFPKEVVAPEGVRFDYLMYENDYNAVPRNANAANYNKKYQTDATSGMHFRLTNQKAFGPGVNAFVNKVRKGEWYHISFDCFKPSKAIRKPANIKGFVVVSFHRGDSTLHYTTFSINDLLESQNKQLVDKWENLSLWYEAPDNIEQGDRLKIYHWNPMGGDLYLDDFIVETWTTEPLAPEGLVLSHRVLEQNYETSDLAPQTTKETAARGLFSCVLSSQAGKHQYGRGYDGTLAEVGAQAGDYIKVSFYALKKHKVRKYVGSASMVVSLGHGNEQRFWRGLPIDARLCKDGKQTYGQWINLEMWQVIPKNAKPTDRLKIYPWNKQPFPIYIDDLRVEVWKKEVVIE